MKQFRDDATKCEFVELLLRKIPTQNMIIRASEIKQVAEIGRAHV